MLEPILNAAKPCALMSYMDDCPGAARMLGRSGLYSLSMAEN